MLAPEIFVGTSGWAYSSWKGGFYPKNLKGLDLLSFYAQRFSTVEINTTFYRFTRESTFQKWRKVVPQSFLFSVKLNRYFTHLRKLNLQEEDWKLLEKTIASYKILGTSLGSVFIQLPPSFSNKELLCSFLEKLSSFKIPVAVEIRNTALLKEEVLECLKRLKISFVISDSPKWPTLFVKTSDFVYLRFHGKPRLFILLIAQRS